jgi:hypothetical protein
VIPGGGYLRLKSFFDDFTTKRLSPASHVEEEITGHACPDCEWMSVMGMLRQLTARAPVEEA